MRLRALAAFGLSAALAAGLAANAAPVPGQKPAASPSKKTHPDQSTVAMKRPFATAPAAKGALSAKDLVGAKKFIGKTGAFQGTVSTVYSPKNHAVVILDFDPDYKQALTAIVRAPAYTKLPDLKALKGRHVLVSGAFKDYKGQPQIEITDASQVKLLP